ncbi:MAG: DUF2207 domain-containing protein [Alphaproteobacteria bacterium]|nr:DUF2207 domain-containing protein [Alphaproteobacteria bacterium]
MAGSEKIISFKSYITIRPDSVAEVTETIAVMATGEQIKHGIYRDFPTTYRDKLGNIIEVGFRVKKVLRDNRQIPYSIESLSNGKRIYLGDPHVLIAPGTYSFVLNYEVDRELGYFRDYDEFYWNVTGNGWVFPIDHAEATIEIPTNAKILQQSGYTGYSGSTTRDYAVTENSGDKITFATTRGLGPKEGLTVAVGWPKGFVKEPSALDGIIFLVRDNAGIASGLGAFFLLLMYYTAIVWRVKANEPLKTVIPLFAPPKDIPVAAVSYIYHKGIDDKTLPATIISMAVSGYLKITQQEGIRSFSGMVNIPGQFLLEKSKSPAVLPDIEKMTGDALFSEGDALALKKSYCGILQRAMQKLTAGLQADFRDGYFCDNSLFIKGGLAFTLLSGIVVFAPAHWAVTPLPAIIIVLTFLLNGFFRRRVKSYTSRGKDVATEIEGFKMFLSVTETERFNLLNPPEVTPELFEKYFPYAVALGVENKWGDKFSSQLMARGRDPQSYHPRWYGSPHPLSLSQLSSNLGSGLSSAISSSSSPPGRSSGSRGGGSSGRGGGGGGGGGF